MSIISAIKMMKWYLYGFGSQPELDSEQPIREPNETLDKTSRTYEQGFASYMTEGAGRFAVGAASSLVRKFFEAPDKSLFETIKSSPNAIQINADTVEIDKKSLNDLINAGAYYGIKQSQYELDDSALSGGRADHFDRAFVWGSTQFKLGDGVRFRVQRILDVSGNFISEKRTIEHYSVVPDTQNREYSDDDFDFNSKDGVTGVYNSIFEPVFDPSKIGRTIYIKFKGIDQIAPNTYDDARYAADKDRLASAAVPLLAAVDHLVAGSNYLASELFQNGVARWIDEEGRAILYGSNDADDMSASKTLKAGAGLLGSLFANDSPLERYRKANGVALYGDKGDDKLTSGDKADHLLGGVGNDTIDGGGGADEIDGGTGNDAIVAGSGAGAKTAGGLGRDIVINRTTNGYIWGDYAAGADANGARAEDSDANSDLFEFAPNTIVMDAQRHDILRFGGIALTGGDAAAGELGRAGYVAANDNARRIEERAA